MAGGGFTSQSPELSKNSPEWLMDRKAMGLPAAPCYFQALWARPDGRPVAARSQNGAPVGHGLLLELDSGVGSTG